MDKKQSNNFLSERCIKLGVNFIISKGSEGKKMSEELFRDFNALRRDINTDYHIPPGIKVKIVEENYSEQGYADPVSKQILKGKVKGYARTKPFIFKYGISRDFLKIEQNKDLITMKKMGTEESVTGVRFVPKTNYSFEELAQDILFLYWFTTPTMLNRLNLLPINLTSIRKKNKDILVIVKEGCLDYSYPLRKRIELLKKNKELDTFIFGTFRKEEFLKNCNPNGLKVEVEKLLKDI